MPAKKPDEENAMKRTVLRVVADELARSGLSRTALNMRPSGVRVNANIATMQTKHQTAIR